MFPQCVRFAFLVSCWFGGAAIVASLSKPDGFAGEIRQRPCSSWLLRVVSLFLVSPGYGRYGVTLESCFLHLSQEVKEDAYFQLSLVHSVSSTAEQRRFVKQKRSA